ncbi:ATP-binding protein [Streptomyces sp. NBC_01306]|uniref:ATP-binding protein n=1 Tax=Streptomyces sp. NBC_01306 TaxID=2903819 RepID=UPI002B1CEE09|nr:ATP-binding protein [Streptomyces sp. NBC_01306]
MHQVHQEFGERSLGVGVGVGVDVDGRQSVDWICQPRLAADAREAAFRFLAGLHPAPPAHVSQNLVLLVSELVTNALRHAGGVTVLRLRADRCSVEVAVVDPSPAHPQDRTPDLAGRNGGFGWPMVQRLARTVAVRNEVGGGKAVCATLTR